MTWLINHTVSTGLHTVNEWKWYFHGVLALAESLLKKLKS